MRIAKTDLIRRWLASSVLAILVFAVLALLDQRLKALSGLSSFDLQQFSSAGEYRITHLAWMAPPYALRAGLDLGLDYLLMPLYAAAFFYAGVIVAGAVRNPRLKRLAALAAMVPVAGALLDAGENALETWLVLQGASDRLVAIAFALSNAKYAALVVGLVLWAGAVFALVTERKAKAA
jgi:hypothetical protein